MRHPGRTHIHIIVEEPSHDFGAKVHDHQPHVMEYDPGGVSWRSLLTAIVLGVLAGGFLGYVF